jgi:hypothetical protein
MLVYALIGYFVYSILSVTRLFSGMVPGTRRINAFDLDSLRPVAAWSLVIALYFVGGVTLSLLTLPSLVVSLQVLVGYVPVTVAPVLVFFLSMRTVHEAMLEAKERELQIVRANLVAASEALAELPAEGSESRKKSLLDYVDCWAAYQKHIAALPEWPYTNDIRRNLALSSLLPVAVGLAQGMLPKILQRVLPPQVLELLRWLLPLAW